MMNRGILKEYSCKINEFHLKHKRMPSYSEMLKIFALRSKNAVFKRVKNLIRAGLLEKDRAGKIVPAKIYKTLPLLGFIQAGFPSPAEEELQDVMSLDEYLISNPEATFLLKVEGESMLDAGIHPGDIVLVQKNITPKTGDIVVARVDNEWTLKYFEKRGRAVILRTANKAYPPIIPKNELVIAGVIIANVRKYR